MQPYHLAPAATVIVVAADGAPSAFSAAFDDEFPVGSQKGNNAFFGRNVLQGLVDGIDDYVQLRQPRWRRYRSIGPALLGSAMWIDDAGLIDKIGELSAACIVVTKQGRKPRDVEKLTQLEALNARTPGMPVRAFSSLTELAPKIEGKSAVVGPSSPMQYATVPTIRTLGFRKVGRPTLPPILHAELALLGHLWWHDEWSGRRHRCGRIRGPAALGVLGELHEFISAQSRVRLLD